MVEEEESERFVWEMQIAPLSIETRSDSKRGRRRMK
jgi:hypothetical protein